MQLGLDESETRKLIGNEGVETMLKDYLMMQKG
jgi:hypothetical protein